MAATNFTPISLYYSSTASNVPTAGNLVAGELAINTADGRLYYKDSAGVVQVIGTKGGVGSSTTTQVLYNSSGLVVGSANMTFSGTALTLANDASISGLTVGKGGGSLSTNTVVGSGALAATNSGGYSVAVGLNTASANTSGQITAVGSSALYTNTTGTNNTAIGISGLYSNTTGGSNSSLGHQALFNNTTASNNTAVGYQAGYSLTTGSSNTILGYQAGVTIATGSNNTYIGGGATASSSSVSNELVLSTSYGWTGKGASTGYIQPNGGGVYQGNNSATWSITSDARLKKNIVDNTTGLDAISQIQVRNFEYRTKDEVTDLPSQNAIEITGVQLGAIAQEIQAILPECVKTESTGVMSVDTTNLTWYLVNAVKELKAEIDQLKGK